MADSSDFSPYDTGDKGLDIVGWVPVADSMPNRLLVFGQCACSKEDWTDKQSSSSAEAWRGTIQLSTTPYNLAFVPFCFRRADGSWHTRVEIRETVLIDRLRFVLLLGDDYRQLKMHFSFEPISQMLEQKAALV